MNHKLVLKWKDQDGKDHSREYEANQASEVEKARRWLVERGAIDIDVAVRLPKP